MTPPVTETAFHSMTDRWSKSTKYPGENYLEVWSPVSDAYRRIRQFITSQTQNPTRFIYVDCLQSDQFTFSDLETNIGFSLRQSTFNLSSWLAVPSHHLGLFLTGLDHTIKQEHTDLINKLLTYLESYSNINCTIFTELNLDDSSLTSLIRSRSTLSQNITYQPVYDTADCNQFLNYLESKWSFSINPTLKQQISTQIYGHLLLIKECARLIRDNPNLKFKDLLRQPSLIRKGIQIFQNLSSSDQATVAAYLRQTLVPHPSDYLQKTNILTSQQLGIPYWFIIKDKITSLSQPAKQPLDHLSLYTTNTEREIMDVLEDSNQLVSRELIAQTMWKSDWANHYSDWAIDKTMSRLRQKIVETHAPFDLVTKKGQGYILLRK